jgi:hypothetical protein
MSYDRYERVYHLTPNGWVLGKFYFYATADEKEPAPKDRVLTLVKEVEQSSGYSPEEISWREAFRSTDRRAVSRLLKKFGDIPTHAE